MLRTHIRALVGGYKYGLIVGLFRLRVGSGVWGDFCAGASQREPKPKPKPKPKPEPGQPFIKSPGGGSTAQEPRSHGAIHGYMRRVISYNTVLCAPVPPQHQGAGMSMCSKRLVDEIVSFSWGYGASMQARLHRSRCLYQQVIFSFQTKQNFLL